MGLVLQGESLTQFAKQKLFSQVPNYEIARNVPRPIPLHLLGYWDCGTVQCKAGGTPESSVDTTHEEGQPGKLAICTLEERREPEEREKLKREGERRGVSCVEEPLSH